MTKAQRKRRAVIGAIALLEWRDRMRRTDVELGMAWWNGLSEQERLRWSRLAGNTGRAVDAWEAFKGGRDDQGRFDLMVAEMRRASEEFSWRKPTTPTPSPLQSTGFPAANGNGHAGAI